MQAPMDIGSSTRPSLKSDSQFNKYHIWKHKLRENCYKRVREDRTRLLWKMRLPDSHLVKDMVKSAFQDIVSDELRKMKDSSLHNMIKVPTSDSEFDDLLWEYNGVHNTYEGECEEILLEMQRIFYEDLKVEPTIEGIDCISETWEDEDEYLARAVYEHMQLNADQAREEIWCPICKKGELKESRCLIYCIHCELRLSKVDELTLDFLRERLAEAHTEHFDRGCRSKPKFCMETRFNLTALYISCEDCDTLEVVI
ncbi:RPA-interacting protein isoform X2 [Senna tora]|uniref:RPA-interacting protein isoform X2 n=1 Tax=Senna tora TaxID=362788 RepID=A0A834X1T8_9FABA|nr:RPA-interacting protein isoform X2 [Senna tora]